MNFLKHYKKHLSHLGTIPQRLHCVDCYQPI